MTRSIIRPVIRPSRKEPLSVTVSLLALGRGDTYKEEIKKNMVSKKGSS